MLKIHIFLLSLLINVSAYAQKYNIDTLDVVANAKIFFLSQDTSFYTYRGIVNFLNDTNDSEILSVQGFSSEILFVKIKRRNSTFQAVRKEKIPEEAYIKNRVPFSCDYIIACNTKNKTFFRLKGFSTNDFPHLFKKKYRLKDKKNFLETFCVQELDLSCLFDNYFGKKKKNIDKTCLRGCQERDKQFIYIEVD